MSIMCYKEIKTYMCIVIVLEIYFFVLLVSI